MNKVVLMGRLTRDPEVRYTSADENTMITSFSLAVNRRFANKNGQREADFLNIVTFGKTAEFCKNYFTKGQQVGIIGRIQTRNWDDDQGKKHYVTEIVGEEAYFADSKRDNQQGVEFTNTFGQDTMINDVNASEFNVDSDDDLPF